MYSKVHMKKKSVSKIWKRRRNEGCISKKEIQKYIYKYQKTLLQGLIQTEDDLTHASSPEAGHG